MKNIRINVKLTVAVFLIITLCISLIYVFAGATLTVMMKNSEIENLNNSLKVETDIIEEFVENQEIMLNSFSNASEVIELLKDPDNPEKQAAAQDYTEKYYSKLKNWEGLYIGEWNTHVIAHSDPDIVGMTTRQGEQLKQLQDKMLKNDGIYNAGMIVSPASQKLVLSIYCPVYDDISNEIIGYVGGGPYAEELEVLISNAQYKKSSYYMLNNENNTYIFNPDKNLTAAEVKNKEFLSIMSAFGDDSSEWEGYVEYRDKNDCGYLAAYQYLPEYNWTVISSNKKEIIFADIDTCMRMLLIICIVSIIVITVFCWTIITIFTKPLKHVEESITQLKIMNLDKSHNLDGYIHKKSEIGQIATALDSLYDSIGGMLEAEKEKHKAIAANESKAKFLANMSHEIRTPINAIIGMNEMIMRESEDENALKYAENIKNASSLLMGIINDILDYTKMDSGKLRLIEDNYNLLSMLNDATLGISERAEHKNLKFITNFDKELPSVLRGDEIRIKQILNNLLTNAVKYTSEGKITFSAKGIYDNNTFLLVLSVSDTGCGIRKEDLKHLFNSFERLDIKKHRNIEGTGLGMSITKQLTELMKGDVYVESEYGKGSSFTVTIPQQIIDITPIAESQTEIEEIVPQNDENTDYLRAPEAKVLAVDDNELNLEILEALLERSEVQLTLALGGSECIELTKKEKYDLILMDHMMPEPNGIETFNIIRSDTTNPNCKTPVVVVTANAGIDVEAEYMSIGFSDYIAKPIDVNKLESVLAKYLK